jgi:hypothetical protein
MTTFDPLRDGLYHFNRRRPLPVGDGQRRIRIYVEPYREIRPGPIVGGTDYQGPAFDPPSRYAAAQPDTEPVPASVWNHAAWSGSRAPSLEERVGREPAPELDVAETAANVTGPAYEDSPMTVELFDQLRREAQHDGAAREIGAAIEEAAGRAGADVFAGPRPEDETFANGRPFDRMPEDPFADPGPWPM